MTHAEFVAACRAGTLIPVIDPSLAARVVSGRLMLPLVRLPVLGIGVALALVGWFFSGLAVIALGALLPRLVARTAPRMLLDEALANEARYQEMLESGLLRVD